MPNSRFALHGLARPYFTVCAPFLSLIHGLCALFRLLLTPLSTAPSRPSSQFTVCTSRFARRRAIANRKNLCDFGVLSAFTTGIWVLFLTYGNSNNKNDDDDDDDA